MLNTWVVSNLINPYLFDDSQALADAFEARVLADGGVFEAESCLVSQLQLLRSLGGLYSQASLILTPNGYKEEKMYSLKPTSGAGDFSFTRGGTAYRKGPSLVETVPYNLLQRSEEFDNAIWILGGGTVISANVTTAPDGTLTADLLGESNMSSNFAALQSVAKSTVATPYTFSVYIKPGGRTWAIIQIYDGTADGILKYFDVQNGVVGTTSITGSSLTLLSAAITPISNGWYRCSVSVLMNTTATVRGGIFTALSDGGGTIHVGTAGIGLYVWGGQMVVGSTDRFYQKTTNRNNFPRPDYELGSCPAWLVEPQRTNLALRSEEFDNAVWAKTSVSVSPNTVTAPDGVNTADSMLETVFNGGHYLAQNFTKAASSLAYTLAVYAKKLNGRDWIRLSIYDGGSNGTSVWLNILTGTTGQTNLAGSGFSITAYSITDVGNGWYRCVLSATSNTATSLITYIEIATGDGVGGGYAGDITKGLYLWGAQLEQAAYATSYIPTTSGSVTRTTDAITTLTGVSSLIGQTEGTIYVDFVYPATGENITLMELSNNTTSNRILFDVFSNLLRCTVITSGVTQAGIFVSNPTATRHRSAVVYRSNYVALFLDGTKIGEDLSATIPSMTTIKFLNSSGGLNFYGRQYMAMLIPTAISDATAISLTTP